MKNAVVIEGDIQTILNKNKQIRVFRRNKIENNVFMVYKYLIGYVTI
jgi:hypothetical protein